MQHEQKKNYFNIIWFWSIILVLLQLFETVLFVDQTLLPGRSSKISMGYHSPIKSVRISM